MTFLNLFWAGVVAAVVVPLLLILYFLKLRRREELVASTLLWKRAVQDLQVNAPFQRLRKNLLLFLQLLILAAAILALARPIIESTVTDEERLVILIDHSASMNTVEADGRTRLEHAKEQAVGLVRTLNQRADSWLSMMSFTGAEAKTQAMVIAFAERATIVAPFTTNTTELDRLIAGIRPTDAQTDLREALELAEAYMAPPVLTTDRTPISAEVPSKLVLISDGRIANLDKGVLRSGEMELIRVGETTENVGITTLRTQRNYEQPEMLQLFLTVQNFADQPVQTDVSIYADETLAHVVPVSLGPRRDPVADHAGEAPQGAAQSLSFDVMLDRGAVIEARLARHDALEVDNSAWTIVPPPRRLRVLVVTRGNLFLDSALHGLPLAEHPFVTPEEYEANAGGRFVADGRAQFDVVIFDKVVPRQLPAGSHLFIGAVPPMAGLVAGAPLEWHTLIWWDEAHPVLRHVGLTQVVVAEGLTLEVPDEAEVLIEGPQGPVLARYAEGGRHVMVLTFAIEHSNWWSSSFPVFMYNALRYLGSGGAEVASGLHRPGATLRIPTAADVEEVRVLRPDSRTDTVRADAAGMAYYGATEQVGLYTARGAVAGRERYAVNLEDAWESDIAPPTRPLKIAQREVAEMQSLRTTTPEVWRWFVGAALALALVEWYIYNRRVMI